MPVEFVVRTSDPARLDAFLSAHPSSLSFVVSTVAGYVRVGSPDVVIVHCGRGSDALREALVGYDDAEVVGENPVG